VVTMEKRKEERRRRRSFTDQFKAEVVALVRDGGKKISDVVRDLELTESSVRKWVQQAEIDSGRGPAGALTTAEREELARLRRECRQLRLVRETIQNATAFFAKESR
jgi:transposase